ncbi:MAG: 2-amino-4-hydroxy-6-hydroxymethyldihydropteridine diphosphokinase [Dysgonomonas sp.]|nr:2-amino-4-hydroxy-6-hydroxymethyldihydropteridine diphosphokinase [Dysgonomonas sp.]
MNSNKLHHVYLGLGSNLNDKERNIQTALSLIEETVGEVISVSSFYRTEPVGFESDNTFINAACYLKTELTPKELLNSTQKIEKEIGRKEKSINGKYSDRLIDIDILLYDDVVVNEPDLTIPHPLMHRRSFVILPLSEIAPDTVHPILKKTIGQIKEELELS